MKAILSVSNKAGLIDFARGLADIGVEIYSTGGTHHALDAAGIPASPSPTSPAFRRSWTAG